MNIEKSSSCRIMTQLCHEMDDLYHNYALKCDLSDAALCILCAVWESDTGCTQSEICDAWFFSRQTINNACNSLERKNLVRLESVAGNRKSKHIVLTKTGIAFAKSKIDPLLKAEERSFEALSSREQALLLNLTRKRLTALRTEMDNALESQTDTIESS